MDVFIQPSNIPVILYPEDVQESGSRIKGYVEFVVKNTCELIDVRFRILGRKRIVKDVLKAVECEDVNASKQFPNTIFLQDIKLLEIHNGQEINFESIKFLSKGNHIFAFDTKIPSSLPGTHENPLSKVDYELVLHVRGRPKNNLFKLPFMFTKSIPLLIKVHPSLTGDKGLNNFHRLLKSQCNDGNTKLLVHSNNSRYGGCIDFSILHRMQGEKITITNLSIELQQTSSFRGQDLGEMEKQCIIGDLSSIRSEKISQENVVLDDQYSINSTSSSITKTANHEETFSNAETMQRIEIKAWFPERRLCNENAFPFDFKETLNEWHCSTPFSTNDETRFLHFMKASITFSNSKKQEKQLIFQSPLVLVGQDFRTAAVQLPDYASATGYHKEKVCTP